MYLLSLSFMAIRMISVNHSCGRVFYALRESEPLVLKHPELVRGQQIPGSLGTLEGASLISFPPALCRRARARLIFLSSSEKVVHILFQE